MLSRLRPRLRLPVQHSVAQSARCFASASREPTIFAPATGRGKSAISILRISGPDALEVWRRMTGPARTHRGSGAVSPKERRAVLRSIVHPETKEVLDEGIVLYFPPESALTAQPTLELHTHGSPALMNLLLVLLPTLLPSFRIAEPGEFTRLAFEAGKMDLTEVEGIRDLVEADTEAQRKLAARQAGGQVRATYEGMRASIIESMSLVEALIDFGEDEGISETVFDRAKSKVVSLRDSISKLLDDGRRGEIIRAGIQLAIIGAPNAGKSSLLNLLARRDAAIVDSVPGTTRDVVELAINFHGFPVVVADTAGLRETADVVESIGVIKAQNRAEGADLKICLLSASSIFSASSPLTATMPDLALSLVDRNTLIVLNKLDSISHSPAHFKAIARALAGAGKEWIGGEEGVVGISVHTGEGMEGFVARLRSALKDRYDLSDDVNAPIVSQARHRRHLEDCRDSLDAFLLMGVEDMVLAAEELRYAILSLGKITGAVDVEEVLGEIFRGFCVGK